MFSQITKYISYLQKALRGRQKSSTIQSNMKKNWEHGKRLAQRKG